MIFHLLYPLHTSISAFNVFRYITFRTIYASLTAFLICFLLGPWVIKRLHRLQVGQFIRDDGPETHFKKSGTPTMGGVLIIGAVVAEFGPTGVVGVPTGWRCAERRFWRRSDCPPGRVPGMNDSQYHAPDSELAL